MCLRRSPRRGGHVAAKKIYERRYKAVAVGCGGDGTLGALLRDLSQEYASIDDLPAICTLPLGNGNAVSRYALGRHYRRWCGSNGVRKACAALKNGVNATLSVPVLSTDQNELCFIAGQGFDAFLLDDYKRQAKATQNTIIGPLMQSPVGGYFFAMALRTLPAYLRRKRQMRVRVEALSKCAYVDPRRGDAAIPVETGLLYEGSATPRAPGSTPFYGGGMRLFPFARSDKGGGGCHLRIAVMSPWRSCGRTRMVSSRGPTATTRWPWTSWATTSGHITRRRVPLPVPALGRRHRRRRHCGASPSPATRASSTCWAAGAAGWLEMVGARH